MASGSKSKKGGRQSGGDADGDFVAARLPIMNTAASKRKQRRSSVKQTLVEDTTSESESDRPASKRAKTRKNESGEIVDNNGMIRIIPPGEVQIRQIKVTIILSPPVVNQERLAQLIQSMPEEIQENIRVKCVFRPDNVNFLRAFLNSKDVMAHGTQIKKAVKDCEVVLSGKNFLGMFNRLHPNVIGNAKNLKIVYITEDITMATAEWKKRQDAHDEAMAKYYKFQRMKAANWVLPEFCIEEPPAPIRARHKMYPMSEPRWGSGECQVMMACRKFKNVEHLTIDLTSHINYDGIDKGKFNTDTWYGDRVGEHIYAAIGFMAFSTRHNNEFDTPAQARGENKLKKLTLILGSKELSRPEVAEDKFAASIISGFRGPSDAPNWQWLRYYFRTPKTAPSAYGNQFHGHHFHGQTYKPFVHTPFTVFGKDEQAGWVSYELEPPNEVEAEDEGDEE